LPPHSADDRGHEQTSTISGLRLGPATLQTGKSSAPQGSVFRALPISYRFVSREPPPHTHPFGDFRPMNGSAAVHRGERFPPARHRYLRPESSKARPPFGDSRLSCYSLLVWRGESGWRRGRGRTFRGFTELDPLERPSAVVRNIISAARFVLPGAWGVFVEPDFSAPANTVQRSFATHGPFPTT